MGAYAVPSNQPFVAKGEIKRKRKPGRLEELTEFLKGTDIHFDSATGNAVLMRGDEVVGVFKDEDDGD
ncbi:MAG: hypothetical protein NC177_07775 [Ruminococcus flavefaciens]|nr:hypothetical protein [Ruminococcus flavefaciens]